VSAMAIGIFVTDKLLNDVLLLMSVTNSFQFCQYEVSPKISY